MVAKPEASENLSAHGSGSSAASWDKRSARGLDARAAESHASFSSKADSNASYSDTSRFYHKLVVYADLQRRELALLTRSEPNLANCLKPQG